MYNLYERILSKTHQLQFSCGGSLMTIHSCGLKNKYEDLWSHHNYIVYVLEGRKIWHTTYGSYDLNVGSCVFIRKGASIVEQFNDTGFCFILFFVPDDFICEVLKSKVIPLHKSANEHDPVFSIENNLAVQVFFQSMMVLFDANRQPDLSLLDLKFRELILIIADNPRNSSLLSWLCSLLQEPQSVSLQRVMQDNFCFNLKLDEFAKLSARSLSAFKRDFLRLYHTSPGKWLIEKRLDHARNLLTYMGKTVAEAAFESGFESASHFSRSFRERFGACPASLKQPLAV